MGVIFCKIKVEFCLLKANPHKMINSTASSAAMVRAGPDIFYELRPRVFLICLLCHQFFLIHIVKLYQQPLMKEGSVSFSSICLCFLK